MTHRAYLGLGSNLGDRLRNLQEALERLAAEVALRQVSSVYETAPWGYEEQPRFLNAVCCGDTSLSPHGLLRAVKGIEAAMGRVPSFRNAPRVIDIDILLYGDQIVQTPDLVIPHAGMPGRAFVLAPLAEIAARVVHPVLRVPMVELLLRCGGGRGVEWYGRLRPGRSPGPTAGFTLHPRYGTWPTASAQADSG